MKRRAYLTIKRLTCILGTSICIIPSFSSALTLQEVVDAAIQSGALSVTLTSNYDFTPAGAEPALFMGGVTNFSINGNGKTLTIKTNDVAAIRINAACLNISISNLTVKYDPVPFTQGTISGFAADKSYTDVDIHDGYPLPPTTPLTEDLTRGCIHTPTSRAIKYNTEWRTVTNFSKISGGTRRYRFYHQQKYTDDIAAGDQISQPLPGSCSAFEINDSAEVTLKNVDIYASPGMGVFEKRSTRCEYDGVRVIPFSTPTGAANAQLRSANCAGIHSTFAEDGPVVINGTFNSCGDDAICIHGRFGEILSDKTGSTTIDVGFDGFENTYQQGDKINIYKNNGTAFLNRTIVSVANASPSTSFSYTKKLTLDTACTVKAGDIIENENCIGSGYYIANNTITYNRARGMALKGHHGCVYTNTISHMMSSGILLRGVRTEQGKLGEGGFSRVVEIKGNVLDQIGIGYPSTNRWDSGAICIVAEPGTWGNQGHRDILLESNKVSNARGINLQIMNARDITVKDCEFVNTHALGQGNGRGSALGLKTSTVVWMDQCDGVTFTGVNKITNPSAYTTSFCEIAAGATNVTGTNTIHR